MSLTAMVMGPFVYPMIKCVMDTTIVSTERMKRPLCVNVSFTFKMNCLSLKESLLYDISFGIGKVANSVNISEFSMANFAGLSADF